jgi:DNA mismatch repair protein MutS
MCANRTILDEYESVLKQSQAKFGSRTVLLYEVGSFYELYSTGETGEGSLEFDIHAVCELLNIQVTRRNKNVLEVSRANFLMAGFPSYCQDKFTKILLDHNHTVVIVNQQINSASKKPTRAITQVLSPGVSLDISSDWNYIMCIYFYPIKNGSGAAISYMDVGTGECSVLDLPPSREICDEINRVLLATPPREVYLAGEIGGFSNPMALIERLDLHNVYVHNRVNQREYDFDSVFFQNQFLRKVYPNTGLLQPLEFLNVERHPMVARCFVALLVFVSNHSEQLLKMIGKPAFVEDKSHLKLSASAAAQLNVTSPSCNAVTLMSTLNRCKTAIGRRAFTARVLQAPTCVAEIEKQYDKQDAMISSGDYTFVRKCLAGTLDIKRAIHRMEIGVANVSDILNTAKTLSKLEGLECCGTISSESDGLQFVNDVKACKAAIDGCIDLEASSESSGGPIKVFKHGIHSDLDEMFSEMRAQEMAMDTFVSKMNQLAGADMFKKETTDRDGAHLAVTVKRFKQFEAAVCAKDRDGIVMKRVSASSTSCRVFHPSMTTAWDKIILIKDNIKKTTEAHFLDFAQRFVREYEHQFNNIVASIGCLDVCSTNAANAVDFYYTRPKIEGARPFVKATGLRHALVERIQHGEAYVPNDVHLDSDGILLYGVNASGKSCFMKSVGLAIIMACSGMYVPCSEMSFYPFQKIFTRIPSGDDISRGRSTFTNEVIELRNIMSNACNGSLVIGDELCSGTESVSAMAIVAAGIVSLSKAGTAFVFASHLHGIVQIPEVEALSASGRLNVFHMGVVYNDKEKRLVYDRVMQPGPGSSLYGLEVCRALDMDPAFIMLANGIRERIVGTPWVPRKKSRYNAKLYKDVCSVCGGKGDDVHHVVEQHQADSTGKIGHFHKNALHNLQNICKRCHVLIHAQEQK